MKKRFFIMDDYGIVWASDSPDAEEKGKTLMAAVAAGDVAAYAPDLDTSWAGDLIFSQELSRTC